MLKKKICKQCQAKNHYGIPPSWREASFEFDWQSHIVACPIKYKESGYNIPGHIRIDDAPPMGCYYVLEQLV